MSPHRGFFTKKKKKEKKKRKLSVKRGERYSDTVGFVRRRIRFDLIRTCVIALRGHKNTQAPDSIRDLDLNLRPVAY